MKKRILSLALAWVMLAAFIPAAAAETEEEDINVIRYRRYEGFQQAILDNYQFVMDEEAIGEWEGVDHVRDISDFNPNWQHGKVELHYTGYTFLPNGKVRTTIQSQFISGEFEIHGGWTKGYVTHGTSKHYINQTTGNHPSVLGYEIKRIGDELYMFIGHPGDYFVFVKKCDYQGDDELFGKVLEAQAAVETEYNTWSHLPSDQRDLPKDQKTPFRIMWLVYTNGTYQGKDYPMSDSTLESFKKSLDKIKALTERLANNNVEIINEYKVIDRRVEGTGEHTNEHMVAISPQTAKPEMELYAPVGEYHFVYTVSAIPNPSAGGNYRNVFSGQGFSSSTIENLGGDGSGIALHYLHEMLHAFEFRSSTPINIEMPLLHISCCEFPVGYEEYAPGGTLYDKTIVEETFVTADIQYTDPKTDSVSYVGIYPSIWEYITVWHKYLATIEKTDVELPPEPEPEGSLDNFEKVQTYDDRFTDMDWSRDWVAKAYEYGIIAGTSATTYGTAGNMLVQDALVVASKIHATYYTGTDAAATEGAHYPASYISYALDNGIIDDRYEGHYTRAATRAELAHIWGNILPQSEFPTLNAYVPVTDVPTTHEHYEAIKMFYEAGIVTGTPDGKYSPDNPVSRGECAVLFVRLVSKVDRNGYAE